jgi:hypothetical protein
LQDDGTMHTPPSIHPPAIYFKKSDALNTGCENLINDISLFEAQLHFGTYLPAAYKKVY